MNNKLLRIVLIAALLLCSVFSIPGIAEHPDDSSYTRDNSDGQRDEGVGTKDKTNDGGKK